MPAAVMLCALFALGVWACGITGRHLGIPDHGGMCWDEVVAMLLLESVSVTKTWIEVWGGGMRVEDAHHIYATSVRMGPLPPDQNRGGIW